MTVSTLLRSMTSHELSEWVEFWTLEAKDRARPAKPSPDTDAD